MDFKLSFFRVGAYNILLYDTFDQILNIILLMIYGNKYMCDILGSV